MIKFLNMICIIIIIFYVLFFINENRYKNKKIKQKISNYDIALSLNKLDVNQLKSLNIIPITDNIKNIINNQDVTSINFSKYYPNELLFLNEKQVQSLSTAQLLKISKININSITNSITGITAIFNKLSFIQLQNIASSERFYTIPYNRLSPDIFSKLFKSLPINIINTIISSSMFLTTLPMEHFKIISSYIKPENLAKFEKTTKDITSNIQTLIDNVPPLPEPSKLPSGEINTDLETNDQLFIYLPIILLLSSPILLSKIKNDPIKILKSLPKIILDYLVPTSTAALYFTDFNLLKLFNDAGLINIVSEKVDYTYPEPPKDEKCMLAYQPIKNEIKPLNLSEIQNLTESELLNMTKIQLVSIFLYLSPKQILSLKIIKMNENINYILNNKDLSKVNFSKYQIDDLLFLSPYQVESLSFLQFKTIKETLKKKSDLAVLFNKLNNEQIQYLISTSNYIFPFNKLSIDQLNMLPKDFYIKLPKKLPTFVLSLDQDKFDSISNNFTFEQIQNYNKYLDEIVNNIINISKNDVYIKNEDAESIILIYIILLTISQQIGNKLIKLNINPIEILKKLPLSLKNKILIPTIDILKLSLIDSYTLNLFNDAELIAPF